MFFRFSMVVASWLVIGVVVLVWLWECDCFDLFQNLGMGMCLFQFGFGDVVVLICSNGLLLFCLVNRGVWMVDLVVLFGWWMWLFCLDGGCSCFVWLIGGFGVCGGSEWLLFEYWVCIDGGWCIGLLAVDG